MEKRKISPWLIAFRILFTLGLIWTVFFIFSNSLQIAAESSARSQEAMAWVNDKLAILSLGPLSEHVIRKLAHFAEYCLLGFFAMLCLRVYTRQFVRGTYRAFRGPGHSAFLPHVRPVDAFGGGLKP